MLIENIDNVPGLGEDEKVSMVAQAKCILASRYFDVFRHYGGIPLIKVHSVGQIQAMKCPVTVWKKQ